ncbi:MAG: tetratricopeptide repeat protein [Candidatus Omnitrophica bacterium]|nr:tetratricopeptide repeat protein [Candidatus Omnitrophota bacterium]
MAYLLKKSRVNWLAPFFLGFFSLNLLTPTYFVAWAGEDQAHVYFFQALKYKEEGRILAAERLFRRAIELEPENADFHFELGNLYVERNNLPGAKIEYGQATMITPNHIAAHYNLGLVYRELGEMGEARSEFRRVLEIDPSNVKAQLQIGYTYAAEGFIEDAREAFREAQAMDATNPEPEVALQDLERFEIEAREKAQTDQERRLFQKQRLLSRAIRSRDLGILDNSEDENG